MSVSQSVIWSCISPRMRPIHTNLHMYIDDWHRKKVISSNFETQFLELKVNTTSSLLLPHLPHLPQFILQLLLEVFLLSSWSSSSCPVPSSCMVSICCTSCFLYLASSIMCSIHVCILTPYNHSSKDFSCDSCLIPVGLLSLCICSWMLRTLSISLSLFLSLSLSLSLGLCG